MKPILYKVETYIMPDAENLIKEINDINVANRLNIQSENISEKNIPNKKNASLVSHDKCKELVKFSAENSKLIDIKIMKDITNENATECVNECLDKNIKHNNDKNSCHSDELLCVQKMEFQTSIKPQDIYPAQFKHVSLMSIDERSENSLDNKLNDFCCHGYKNGCTASIPSPEEISEEIFKENWLQKIEMLRHHEACLRERELNLQIRESELFKREKKLRIIQKNFKNKMRQQIKHQKDMLVVEKRLQEAAKILSCEDFNEFAQEEIAEEENIPKEEEISEKAEISKQMELLKKVEIPNKIEIEKGTEISKIIEISKETEISKNVEIPKKIEIPKIEIPKETKISENLQSIINPQERNEESSKKISLLHSKSNSLSRKSSYSKTLTHSYASVKYKGRPKIEYNDLNSTLSAASGESSFVRTSELFNPTIYKKPLAFMRSASERRIRNKDIIEKMQTVESEYMIEEDKIFRKVSDNICALQEKETKFQDYGLVDCKPDNVPGKIKRNFDNEGKLSSYLDLEIGEKHNCPNLAKTFKNRPVSWNEESNEWLQKKREAYNSMIKQSAGNKENVKCNTVTTKVVKKKPKRFTLFR